METRATLETVEATSLGLRSSSGDHFTFSWRGPSLIQEFSVGESVEVTQSRWSLVRGRETTVAAHRAFGTLGMPWISTLEGTDLKFSSELACTFQPPEKCESTIYEDVYDLRASTDTATINLRPAETNTIGDYRVTNVSIMARRITGHRTSPTTCTLEWEYHGFATVMFPTHVRVDD
jgi:hypothetical protein